MSGTIRLEAMLDDANEKIERLRRENAELRERADSNFASCERIKLKYSECHNELKEAKAKLATAEAALASTRQLCCSWLKDYQILNVVIRHIDAAKTEVQA